MRYHITSIPRTKNAQSSQKSSVELARILAVFLSLFRRGILATQNAAAPREMSQELQPLWFFLDILSHARSIRGG
jgi:hypothetical protein